MGAVPFGVARGARRHSARRPLAAVWPTSAKSPRLEDLSMDTLAGRRWSTSSERVALLVINLDRMGPPRVCHCGELEKWTVTRPAAPSHLLLVLFASRRRHASPSRINKLDFGQIGVRRARLRTARRPIRTRARGPSINHKRAAAARGLSRILI